MRSLTAAQTRFLRFLAGRGDPWCCTIAGATFDRLMHRGLIGGSMAQPHITEKGRTALARAATEEGQDAEREIARLKQENAELQTQLDALVQEVLGGSNE